ncbi:hypothetical protein [Aestuariispira insulae]|uniref:Glycosyl transferase family 1 n=1 Tax=Aestuariispira insulae TaxID=1461337 RepID=A0A3D9H5Q8_9PROT|nr:hypothetical protein [Aestuariispira insulae]RED44286.1 hypothetical protein DFP90_11539 [Aestuariispira insulae]
MTVVTEKKRFVLNTHVNNMGSQVCIFDLAARLKSLGHVAVHGDWDHYDQYDVAVFMGVEADIEKARGQNPDLKIVIADPKQSSQTYIDAARAGDLLLVSSVEQRDAFYRLNNNVLVFPMFPEMEERLVKHVENDEIIIGYHGNKVHLEGMGQHVSPAIEAFARNYRCRLVLIYNIDKLGRVTKGIPDEKLVATEHVQWHPNVYEEVLRRVDIGIVPNLLPVRDMQKMLRRAEVPGLNVNYEPFDFFTRYKASANAGRISVFGKFGIPVVSDFTPSTCQLIEDGVEGVLAGTPHGWYRGLMELAQSAEKRTDMGRALARKVELVREKALEGFLDALDCSAPSLPVEISCVPSAESELKQYRSPPQPSIASRVLRLIERRFI